MRATTGTQTSSASSSTAPWVCNSDQELRGGQRVPRLLDELHLGREAFDLGAAVGDLDGDASAPQRDPFDPEVPDARRQDGIEPHLAVREPGVEAKDRPQAEQR